MRERAVRASGSGIGLGLLGTLPMREDWAHFLLQPHPTRMHENNRLRTFSLEEEQVLAIVLCS
jgi:hypothetical protein